MDSSQQREELLLARDILTPYFRQVPCTHIQTYTNGLLHKDAQWTPWVNSSKDRGLRARFRGPQGHGWPSVSLQEVLSPGQISLLEVGGQSTVLSCPPGVGSPSLQSEQFRSETRERGWGHRPSTGGGGRLSCPHSAGY